MKLYKFIASLILLNIFLMFNFGDLSLKLHNEIFIKSVINSKTIVKSVILILSIFIIFIIVLLKCNNKTIRKYIKDNLYFLLYFLSSIVSAIFYSSNSIYSLYYTFGILFPIGVSLLYSQELNNDFRRNFGGRSK